MSARVANNGEIRAEVGDDIKVKAFKAASATGVSLTDYIGWLIEQDEVDPEAYLHGRIRQALSGCGLSPTTQEDANNTWEVWRDEGKTLEVYFEQS